MKKIACFLSFFCIIAFSVSVFSQETNTDTTKTESNTKTDTNKEDSTINLSKMNVKGDVLSGDKSAYGVTKLSSKKIEDLKLSRTADILDQIPGIYISEYGQGGISNAVTMRGFSSGVHGGDMGVYLDGIPLNEYYGHGGGYADPNVLIPLELEKVLVFKGPSSALFGNFSNAGTVAFYTKKKGKYTKTFTKYGAFNTFDTQAALGLKISDNLWNNTALQVYNTDGYIDNSQHLYGNGATRFTWIPLKDIELSLSLRGHSAKWNSPGYISKIQWEDKDECYQQDPAIGNDGGNRTQLSERLDVNYTFNKNLKLLFWGFGLQSDWIRWANFGSGQSERNYSIKKYGTGTSINYKDNFASVVGGIEYYADDTKYKQYSTISRKRTGLTTDVDTIFHNLVILAESEFKIIKYFKPVVGIRADLFTGKEKDNINLTDRTFNINKYYHISPKAGFVSTIIDKILDFKFSFSNGYKMPLAEVMHKNISVSPSNLWQYETGFKIKYKKQISWDITGYILDTDNEIQDISGSGDYQNYGKTRRMGVETDINYQPIKKLFITGSFSYTHSEILKNVDTLLEGKAVPTIPSLKSKLGVKYTLPFGLGASATWTFTGKAYTSNDNSETRPLYNLIDAGLFYAIKSRGKKYTVNVDFKNILNTHYASFASENLWTTGAPFSAYVSLSMKY